MLIIVVFIVSTCQDCRILYFRLRVFRYGTLGFRVLKALGVDRSED